MYSAFAVFLLAVITCLVISEEKTAKRECGAPPEYDKAKIKDPTDEPYPLESTVTYLCDHGYVTGGGARKQSKCVEDPKTRMPVWTKVEIACSPKSCGDPGFVMNAQKIGSRFTFPNNVTYRCDPGYKMAGSPRRFCLASGAWSGTLPTCNKISCQRPRDPENGLAVYVSLEYDSELTYECDQGFQLSSNVRKICGSDEKWAGEEPFCKEIECEILHGPEYGSVEFFGGGVRVGSIAKFTCDEGRKLIGSNTARCLKTGEWSFETPRCVAPCIIPDIINGQLGKYEVKHSQWSKPKRNFRRVSSTTTVNEGEELVLKCGRKYKPKGQSRNSELTIICLNGKLSPYPECITEPCIIPDMPHGQLGSYIRQTWSTKTEFLQVSASSIIDEEDEVVLKCDKNYKPKRELRSQEPKITCLSGKLSPTPECAIKPCIIPDIPNGRLGTNVNVGYRRTQEFREDSAVRAIDETEELILKCDKDFKPKGVSGRHELKIRCLNGEVSPAPECVTTRCYRESLNYNGLIEVEFNYLENGKSFTPRCQAGYRVSRHGNTEISCQEGKWTGNIPPCTAALCSTKNLQQYHGIRLENNGTFRHGQWIQVTCADGFELRNKNNPVIYCNEGEWQGYLPPCFSTHCSTEDLEKHPGIRLQSRGTFGDGQRIQATCADGFVLKNKDNPEIYCDQGEWKGNVPPCFTNTCLDPPPSTPNGKPVVDSTQQGHTIWYKCDDHFKVTRKGNVTCSSGNWIGVTPLCEYTRCHKESLNYPGLINVLDSPVNDGSSFMPICETGSHVTPKEDQKIYCTIGKWTGNIPPCTLDQCKTGDLLKFSGLVLNDRREILDDDEKIWPICSEGFSLNKRNNDSWIYCRNGDWSGNLPPCSPAMCSNDPPVPENGRMKPIISRHAGTAEYECFEFYELSTEEKVVCSYGKWTGTPICKDTRCYLKDLPQKEGVDLTLDYPVRSKEKADIPCIKGYRLRRSEFACERGQWKVPDEKSPCEEDDCVVVPVENGEILNEVTTHRYKLFIFKLGKKTYLEEAIIGSSESSGAVLHAKCEVEGEEKVIEITCRRGEWIPLSICGKRNISEKYGSPEVTGSTINSFRTSATPVFTDETPAFTETTENQFRPDSSRDVLELNTNNNDTISVCSCSYIMDDKVLMGYVGNKKLTFKDEIKAGSTVTFHCDKPGYNLRGPKNVTCPSGCIWHSSWFPTCFEVTGNNSVGNGAHEVSESTVKSVSTDDVTDDSTGDLPASTGRPGDGSSPDNVEVASPDTISICSCQYFTSDSALIGFVGNRKLLSHSDEVKRDSTVEFHCNEPGYFSLIGKNYITCSPTCEWPTSFPSCHQLTGNDIVITVRAYPENGSTVLARGVYTISSGTRLNIECQIYNGYITNMEWRFPNNAGGSQRNAGCIDRRQDCYTLAYQGECTRYAEQMTTECRRQCNACDSNYPFKLIYTIEAVSSHASGTYTCIANQLRGSHFYHSITIEVKDVQCPEIAQTEHLIVMYESNRIVNTKVYFYCPAPYTRYGLEYITCQPSGEWSAPVSECRYIKCPKISAENPLIVTYSDEQNVNSTVSFHCVRPHKRNGPPFATCMASGKWSGPTASCRVPTCSLSAVYDSIPPNIKKVVPCTEDVNKENVPYGYSINLRCDEAGFVFKGNSTAVCNEDGKWAVDKNVECVKGCARVQTGKDSKLKTSSDKQLYEIGETLTFSCPEGMKLVPDVQRIMCFNASWTPNNIPDCQ